MFVQRNKEMINLRMTKIPCVQCSDPRHQMSPKWVCWVCCWDNSQVFLSWTLWSVAPDTRQDQLQSCHCRGCLRLHCTLLPSVWSHQQMLRSRHPFEQLVSRIPSNNKISFYDQWLYPNLLTCKIFDTLLPFSMTQNCMKRQGRQSSLFSWLGLA